MNRRLVYVISTKLNATIEQFTLQSVGCGMLLSQDINGISLEVLPQYQFTPQNNLSARHKKLAKHLNIGFIWQKFQHMDTATNTSIIYERLLFIDYDTKTPRRDYPSFEDQGVYYELGEVFPYICIDQNKKKAMLYSDNDYPAYQVEDVLLSIHDPKYETDEYHEIFTSQINPYQQWFVNEEKKYHYSFTHQSYSHPLFMPFEEWKETIYTWRQRLTNESENNQNEYELLLKKQASRINYEMTRVITSNPKDFRTITGFEEQLNDLKKQILTLFYELPNTSALPSTKMDDIITDINPNDGTENAMALQDLLVFIINTQSAYSEQKSTELFLNDFAAAELTVVQAYKIINICINYFIWSLYYAKVASFSVSQLDSYNRNLIAFASRMLIICLTFLINSSY